jgi:transcription elongation factor GreA
MSSPGSAESRLPAIGASAAEILKAVGLLADGPVRWGQPAPARGPGVYLVELGRPLPVAPIELTRVGKWLEQVPGLRMDGAHPTSKALVARLASFWLPDAVLLYAGASSISVGPRIGSLSHHVLGERKPHPDGHWLQTLRGLADLRIWWSRTEAPEEALDAIFDAFAAQQSTLPPGRPARTLLLPWANTRRPTGERQPHGIIASLVPDESGPPPPPTRVVDVPPGDADGVVTEARGSGTIRRTGVQPSSRGGTGRPGTAARPPRGGTPARTPAPRRTAAPTKFEAKREPIPLSAEAIERMRVELDEMTRVKRPDVVARIKAARELGDLKENAEYHSAREEQSFLEGRVRLLEDRLRYAVVMDEGPSNRVAMGSVVTVEHAGDEITYSIVGTTEADPAAGRISTSSPVGAALLGATVGSEVEVRTPRGTVRYLVRSIS